ncbi:uncharacterized protein CC84DRAFT_1182135 [Paraphaeosphaeria sporulosa]|uniref:Uncharacterized protein n=1 Tax=Paraphaeosphaeria sporulosa TaxID=1460663 RepID=A0A177BU44_9PLEO|nr:uncharacterized protein CC84DRAFT_1182135 [Paraphaeosphaeria sporulosa]OAF98530.1 hypothetical protein CC84DRAFT_1182135 [Paraphaeosphaeria sporulosa]
MFSLNSLGMKVQRNETVNFLDYGKVMKIISDGSKRNASVMVINVESTPSCTTSIQHGKRDFDTDTPRDINSLKVSVLPTDLELVPRHEAVDPRVGDYFVIEEVVKALYGNLGAYFAGKVPIPTAPKAFSLEKGLLLELHGFICSQGMFYLINGTLFMRPWVFIDGCSEIVGLAFVETGCWKAGWVDETGLARRKLRRYFKPYIDSDFQFYDLDNDAENCGQVGHKCPEGSSCVGSACTSPTCSGPSSAGSAYGTCLGSGGFDDVKFDLPSAFPPIVGPGSSPKSGWEMSFESLDSYLANDFSLPKDWYLVYDGKRTINTKCVVVGELPFATINAFPENAILTFQTQVVS